MRSNTNVASLNAQESATNTNKSITSSLEKLSSGLRINKAADDASGLAIADKLRTQASSLGQGIANANSASALIQIADKAMAEQSNILDIVKQKLIQASTSTTSADGREAIRKDINKLLTQFDNIATQTNYNGTTLLQKSTTDTAKQDELSFQLGENSSFDVSILSTKASNSSHLGGGADTVDSAAVNAASTTTDTTNTDKTSNNIDVAGGQKLSTAGAVTLAAVNVSNEGSEVATSGVDITLSGEVGKVRALAGFNMTFASETAAIQETVRLIAEADANLSYNTATDTLSASANHSVDFGTLEFSSATFTSIAAGGAAAYVELNVDSDTVEFTATNNKTDTTLPMFGQLNMSLQAAATGGNLLSDLKDLAVDGLTGAKANSFMATVDEALTQMNANRSDFGSTQNQLESSIRNMQTTQTNLKAAESVIRDVDYAAESASFNKQNIIAQAGTYAMSQANAMQQNVMRLLQ
jgi:flagellin